MVDFIDSTVTGAGNIIRDLWELPDDGTLGQSEYDFTSRVFPSNLGDKSYNGHWMMINISVPTMTKFASVNGPNGQENTFNILPQELSKVDSLRGEIDKRYTLSNYSLGSGPTNMSGSAESYFVPRFTRRIKESIAIYMPDTQVFTNANVYDDVNLSEVFGAAGSFALQIAGGISARNATSAQEFSSIAGQTESSIERGLKTAAGAAKYATGLAINPRAEVMFKNTTQRQFQFEFLLAPTNEDESKTVEQIIRALRFHSVPEVLPILQGGLFFVKPSEFDITFYHQGVENTKIPRLNTCVIERIDVDYAPSGRWATFSNGYPVQVKLLIMLRELEINHRLRVLQGF